jgi:fumarate reductase flavoprotein subunit
MNTYEETQESKDMDRRHFLMGAVGVAGVAGMTALAGCAPTSGEASDKESANSDNADKPVDSDLGEPVKSYACDVLVVGTGTAGMSAAAQAVERGANVIVIEKISSIGGQSQFAEVMFGCDSRLQKELGLDYTNYELLTNECGFHNWHVDRELWSRIVEVSGESMDWLMDKVEPYGGGFSTVLGGMGAPVVAHMFNTYTDEEGDWEKGGGISHALSKFLQENGVEVMTGCEAKKLQTDGDAVVGLLAESSEGIIQIDATATILACGGFTGDTEMISSLGRNAAHMMVRGYATNMGDGIRMAREVGADHRGAMCTQLMGPSVPFPGASSYKYVNTAAVLMGFPLWVNQHGVRFVMEAGLIYTVTANAIDMQDEVYSIFDHDQLERYQEFVTDVDLATYFTPGTKLDKVEEEIEELLSKKADYVFKADTIEELAKQMNVSTGTLSASIARYNELSELGEDVDFGKDASLLVPIASAPFYAFKVYSNLLCTGGGIRIDSDARVLRPGSVPIPGLYCAGCDCDGFMGETYGVNLPGSTQGISLCTGRLAALHAVGSL